MPKPVLVKLGGSVLTDKGRERSLRRAAARRLLSEVAQASLPTVLLHGAGGFGHPAAIRHRVGERDLGGAAGREAVSEVLAGAGLLHAEVVDLARDAGLRPVSVPLHDAVQSVAGDLTGLPADALRRLLAEGFTPVLGGTLVRDDRLGWRVAGADELLEALAPELEPRLALFVTDVDGVFDLPPGEPGARLLARVGAAARVAASSGARPDATGAMAGKLERARRVAHVCPTLVVNGLVRGRVLAALKGKDVVGSWIGA